MSRKTWGTLRAEFQAAPAWAAAYAKADADTDLGKQLYELRMARGLDIAEAALLAATTPDAVEAIELGDIDPFLPDLQRLCIALGAHLELRVVREAAPASA
ncbi:MAG: helix-turn-helix domain-containing protein [Dehalococcoidia bacterium]